MDRKQLLVFQSRTAPDHSSPYYEVHTTASRYRANVPNLFSRAIPHGWRTTFGKANSLSQQFSMKDKDIYCSQRHAIDVLDRRKSLLIHMILP
jgi:hypothetical protein